MALGISNSRHTIISNKSAHTLTRTILFVLSTVLLTVYLDHNFNSAAIPLSTSSVHLAAITHATIPKHVTTSSAHSDANIAYFLQLTNTTAFHLPRLIARLHHPHNVFAVHFDTKVSQNDISSIIADAHGRTPAAMHNLYVIPSHIVSYAGYSMVINTLTGMQALLDLADRHPWDFFINLSGSDYPLVNGTTQRTILGKYKGSDRNFFRVAVNRRWRPFFVERARTFILDEVMTHVSDDGNLFTSATDNPVANTSLPFEPVYASAWMSLTREFVQFAATSDFSRLLSVVFGYMKAADEHFFISLAYNTPRWRKSLVWSCLRLNVWEEGGEKSGGRPFFLDQKTPDGRFRFWHIMQHSNHLHARKFREPDSDTMDAIDAIADDPKHNARVAAGIQAQVDKADALAGKQPPVNW